jgi:hypothetical protein
MKELLDYFQENFVSYVSSLSLEDGEEVCFGDLLYDYSLFFIGGRYILFVYSTELDHYGMPYRNTLSFEEFDITSIL